MKLNLLLIVKLIYFSDPFAITFILKLNLPSSCIIRWEFQFLGCERGHEFCDLI